MTAAVKFGHRWSLHEKELKPEFGFGYPNAGDCPTRADVEARCADWNGRKKATCTLNAEWCSRCGLCDKEYVVSDIGEENGSAN